MSHAHLKKLLKLEDYVIDKIVYEERQIIVHCHPKKKGMWHENDYSKALSTSRIKTARHMVIEDRVVILKITQRKFF